MDEERKEFVERVMAHEKSKSALCREYGISRPTGDKWLKRYQAGEELTDRSRRPFHTPNRISAEDEERIVSARQKEPAIGAAKARRMFQNQGWKTPPSISTINAVYRRNGLITKEASERATPYKRFEKDAPNILWQADFKGDFAMQNGQRCFPLSIIDDHSRYCLCGDALDSTKLIGVKQSFQATFREYGLPRALLCDNGVPWGSSQTSSITAFEVWLMELGVLTIHIRCRHPQTQGKVERFNGSYKQERLKFYIPADLKDAQRCREEYRHFYNEVRPHHALGLDLPCQHYRSSERQYVEEIKPWEYEADSEVRMVKSSGYIHYGGRGYYLSEGLAEKQVALRPSCQDGVMDILFRQFQVAKLDMNENTIISRRIRLLHDDPREKL